MTSPRNHTSLIQHKKMSFLITDRPNDSSIDTYIETLKANNVTDLVRVCEPSYATDKLEKAGISVHDWEFDDGEPPSDTIIDSWLALTNQVFAQPNKPCIAVHCVAGLGRAPVMVALALIESGMTPEDAVIFIRERRRGAVNNRQLHFLRKYKRRGQPAQGKCVCL
eukprot:m.321297 g.321297  ORF g.321297 m.321297 type:complete len:166 (+) comp25199_c0_seq1:411-908(+)